MHAAAFPSILARLTAVVLAAAVLTVAVSLAWAPPARSATIFEKELWMSGPRYSAKVPLCEERDPLKTIEKEFHTKEGKFWKSELKIVGFEKIQEVSWQ